VAGSALFRAGPAASAVHARLEAGNEEEIDDFDGLVAQTHADGSPARCNDKEFRMLYGQGSSVGQTYVKWLKGLRLMHLPKLLDGHIFTIAVGKRSGN
jgi:hypothetical protein